MKKRTGFTLIEMLVVMSLIALLAGLAIAFLPGAADQQRAARGATMLQGYLGIAKQKAFQRRALYGLRLSNKAGNGIITDFQYLEKPDDFTDKTGVPTVLMTSFSTNALQMDIRGVDLLNGYNSTAADMPFWTVQPGDAIEIMGGGLVHRINGILSDTSVVPPLSILLLASTPDPFTPNWNITMTGNPVNGTFTLTIQTTTTSGTISKVTAPINYNAPASGTATTPPSVEEEVNKVLTFLFPTLTNPLPKCSVTGAAGGPWRLTFLIPTPLFDIQISQKDPSLLVAPPPPMPPALPPPPPDLTISRPGQQRFTYYRIMRAPRVASDEQLQLPKNIAVDLTTNVTYNNGPLPLNSSGDLDILFSPSGAMITPGFNQEFLALWVRDMTANTAFEVGPSLIAVHTRTGAISAHPPQEPPATDPYSFVKDGRAN